MSTAPRAVRYLGPQLGDQVGESNPLEFAITVLEFARLHRYNPSAKALMSRFDIHRATAYRWRAVLLATAERYQALLAPTAGACTCANQQQQATP